MKPDYRYWYIKKQYIDSICIQIRLNPTDFVSITPKTAGRTLSTKLLKTNNQSLEFSMVSSFCANSVPQNVKINVFHTSPNNSQMLLHGQIMESAILVLDVSIGESGIDMGNSDLYVSK